MKFKETKYELFDYEDETETIIGSILYYNGKVCNVKICDEEIGSREELEKVESFLKFTESKEWIRN